MKRKKLMILLPVIAASVAILVYGVTYHNTKNQKSVVNKFNPAVIRTAVQEKNNAGIDWSETENTSDTLKQDFIWKEKVYISDKVVRILNVDKEDENNAAAYIRVCIIPRWVCSPFEGNASTTAVDISTNSMGLKDFGSLTDINITDNTYTMGDVTFTLVDDWSDSWIYNENDGYFYHKNIVQPGDATGDLLKSVSISDGVYGTVSTEGIKLDIDVLADSIQTEAGALYERWGGAETLGIKINEDTGNIEKAGTANE